MSDQGIAGATLPLNLPVPSAQPTGSVLDTRKPYTLPLSQDVALTRCLGPFTEIDRKLWATLIALAWDELPTKRVHEANARDIARLFRQLKGGDNGSAWVMASARRLMSSRLDWETEEEEGSASLLSGLRIKKMSGAIFYQFSDFLLEKLLDNKQFSRLRLHFMIGLSGKYSITLYMMLEAAANLRRPVIDISMNELRDNLSVPEGKLSRWVDLNRFAIEPALKQINDNAVAAGFSVQCEPYGHGRKFERVRLTVTKLTARIDDEQSLRDRLKKAAPAAAADKSTPRYEVDDALAIIRKNAPGLDAQYVLSEFVAWITHSETPIKNPLGLLTDFARRKLKENQHQLF